MKSILNKILQKNDLSSENIQEFSWWQINHTYQIGDKYVLKLQNDLDVVIHQVSLIQEVKSKGALVPHIFDYGMIDGKEYMLMEKIAGRKLSESWHIFNKNQKESFIKQICEQLQIFHSTSFNLYSTQRPKEFSTWEEAIENYTDLTIIEGKEFDSQSSENIKLISDYYEKYKYLLNDVSPSVLIHNDLHFENILFEGDKITAILDFDFARQAPKEYELWHLVDFFHTPKYFVEDSLEDTWDKFTLGDELLLFKKYYPELFQDENLIHRLRIYFIEDILSHYEAGFPERSNHQINSYFKKNWLEKKLGI